MSHSSRVHDLGTPQQNKLLNFAVVTSTTCGERILSFNDEAKFQLELLKFAWDIRVHRIQRNASYYQTAGVAFVAILFAFISSAKAYDLPLISTIGIIVLLAVIAASFLGMYAHYCGEEVGLAKWAHHYIFELETGAPLADVDKCLREILWGPLPLSYN
jgi:hypothetical protein